MESSQTPRAPLLRTRWFALAVAFIFLTPFAAAAISFALARPVCEVALPKEAPHPRGTHNLASYRYGPTITASSADLSSFSHPSFVVDELRGASKSAKWMSAKGDRSPWIEIRFGGAHEVERIAFSFAGSSGRFARGMTDYDIRCLGTKAAEVEVRGNRDASPSHELSCRGALGVRVDFLLGGNVVARVDEIEVFGR